MANNLCCDLKFYCYDRLAHLRSSRLHLHLFDNYKKSTSGLLTFCALPHTLSLTVKITPKNKNLSSLTI